jgi:uncharacterized protein (TIGR00299 family) protein
MSSPTTSPDPASIRHIHLDPVGGIAGDMFLAAVLDVWPGLFSEVEATMRAAGLPDDWQVRLETGRNGAIAGRRLAIAPGAGPVRPSGRYGDIRARLEKAGLPPRVVGWALEIFRRLAEAEAAVHGIAVDEVHFHELADWDSVADIVGAATVIAAMPEATWSTAPLPLGRGRVQTAHGALPVPAPATARLLAGLPVHDDGIAGERVTPTGAAIVAALQPATSLPGTAAVAGSGHGLGSRTLDGVPNVLRLLAFAEVGADVPNSIGIIRFEVDDQTPEDLAIGLAAIAGRIDVRDVCQWPVYGKKGRVAMAVQVLCAPEALDAVAAACLSETTTIGLRTRVDARVVLPRSETTVDVGDATLRAKRVVRPDGRRTAKAEADDLAASGGDREARDRLRRLLQAEGGEE